MPSNKFLFMSFSLYGITPFENFEIANSKEKSLDYELSCDIPSPAYRTIHPKAKQNVLNAYPKMFGYRIPMKSKPEMVWSRETAVEGISPAFSC